MHQVHDWQSELAVFDPTTMRPWEHRWFGPYLIVRGPSGWIASAKVAAFWKLTMVGLDQLREILRAICNGDDPETQDDDTLTETM
jgi:hypothetical protein